MVERSLIETAPAGKVCLGHRHPERSESVGPQGAKVSPESELKEWLEWAGSRFLALSAKSPLPSGYRTFWPDFAPNAQVAYGYTAERLRPAAPSSHEIVLMDELLALPSFIPDVLQRRIVSARSLVTPVSNRYLYSWQKIAVLLHMERRTVSAQYMRGLTALSCRLPSAKRDTIRKTYLSLTA